MDPIRQQMFEKFKAFIERRKSPFDTSSIASSSSTSTSSSTSSTSSSTSGIKQLDTLLDFLKERTTDDIKIKLNNVYIALNPQNPSKLGSDSSLRSSISSGSSGSSIASSTSSVASSTS